MGDSNSTKKEANDGTKARPSGWEPVPTPRHGYAPPHTPPWRGFFLPHSVGRLAGRLPEPIPVFERGPAGMDIFAAEMTNLTGRYRHIQSEQPGIPGFTLCQVGDGDASWAKHSSRLRWWSR